MAGARPTTVARMRARTYLALALLAVGWGTVGVVARQVSLPVAALTLGRVAVGAAGLVVVLALARRLPRGPRLFSVRPVRTLLQGLLLAGHWFAFFAALDRVPIGTVTLVVYVAPVLVALAAPRVLGQRLTWRTVVAVMAAFGGSALVLGPGGRDLDPDGLILAGIAAVLLAVLVLNGKVLSEVYGALRLSLAGLLVAVVALAAPAVVALDAELPSMPAEDWGWLVLLGLAHTALGLAIFYACVRRMRATHASVLLYLEPVAAVGFGWWLLAEDPGAAVVAGGALIVLAGVLVARDAGMLEVAASPEVAGAAEPIRTDLEVEGVPGREPAGVPGAGDRGSVGGGEHLGPAPPPGAAPGGGGPGTGPGRPLGGNGHGGPPGRDLGDSEPGGGLAADDPGSGNGGARPARSELRAQREPGNAEGSDAPSIADRLGSQLGFLLDIDRLKEVERQSSITSGSRRENSAEHSWHLAMFVLVLAEHADDPIDVGRAVTMSLVHDVVEVHAGDTFVYDTVGRADQAVREREAADRLFGRLPQDQAARFRDLWDEFEDGRTPEARFVAAVDRLQPLLLNLANRGEPWRRNGITEGLVRHRNADIGQASQLLGEVAQQVISQAVAQGYLRRSEVRVSVNGGG